MKGPYSAAFGAIHHEDERGFLFTVAPASCAVEVANALNVAHAQQSPKPPGESLPFPVHIQRWPREEGDEPCDEVAFVLSLAAKPWVLMQIAVELKGAGATFPHKTETELAAALHWLLVHVLTPGSGGMETVMAKLKAMRKGKGTD